MTTKAQIVARLKSEYSTLRTGDDERGYTQLTSEEYEDTIQMWAENEVLAEAQALAAAEAKQALLTKLGITEDEAKLLLG
jgi:hypothetical protein